MIPVCGMAYTQTQLDQLEAAIASGVLTVKYSAGSGQPAREQTYQSLDAMRALRTQMIRELGGGGATYRLAATRKGLGA